ncbi:MAG: tetratricopeptide repeat protein [Candidatus Cloacimonetes bacterium]|nr:tetratricopeptide repeat protein [Candidatus Cloacimonadota bacterium]
MSSSSSITHAKKQNSDPENRFIRYSLMLIWVLLILFGCISLIQPTWLTVVSAEGKRSEASDTKTAGDIFLKKGNYKAAIRQYKKAIHIYPEYYDAIGNLGITYMQLNRYDDAVKIFNHLIKKDIKNMHNNYYNLANIYKNKGEYDLAVENYIRSAETNPYPIYSYQYLGEIYLNLQKWDLAIAAFNSALENKLTLENSYYGMLKSVKNSSQSKHEIHNAVITFLSKPISPCKYDREIFVTTLKKDKEIAKTYNLIGYSYLRKKEPSRAKTNFELALKIWPDFKDAMQNLDQVRSLTN